MSLKAGITDHPGLLTSKEAPNPDQLCHCLMIFKEGPAPHPPVGICARASQCQQNALPAPLQRSSRFLAKSSCPAEFWEWAALCGPLEVSLKNLKHLDYMGHRESGPWLDKNALIHANKET